MNQPKTKVVRIVDKNGDVIFSSGERRNRTAINEHWQSRARRDALAFLEKEDARREAAQRGPVPTVREDLQAARRRPWDAPMATRPNHAVDQETILLARILAWSSGLIILGSAILLALWIAP